MDETGLDSVADELSASLTAGTTSPSAVLFAIRSYTTSGRADLRTAIEAGLTSGTCGDNGSSEKSARLSLKSYRASALPAVHNTMEAIIVPNRTAFEECMAFSFGVRLECGVGGGGMNARVDWCGFEFCQAGGS